MGLAGMGILSELFHPVNLVIIVIHKNLLKYRYLVEVLSGVCDFLSY